MHAPPVQCVILGEAFELFAPRPPGAVRQAVVAALLFEARRFGLTKALLISASDAEIDRFRSLTGGAGLELDGVACPADAGLPEALRRAAERLDPDFLLLNGGSAFDVNWLDLAGRAAPGWTALVLALRDGDDFAGIAWAARDRLLASGCLDALSDRPAAVGRADVVVHEYPGVFIDGLSGGISDALDRFRTRPALFLDRDGVLNVDHGYVHDIAKLDWIDGAVDAVKLANDLGYYVFVATNQSGVARGLFPEEAVLQFHDAMQRVLRRHGAHIDDMRYCPFHPEGTVARYARASDWRKPAPGMILDLLREWPVDAARSGFIGDTGSDMVAAQRAGIRGLLFPGGNLKDFMADALGFAIVQPSLVR